MSSGHGERRDADANARRSRRFENRSVNRVHPFELGYIGEEDLRRDHVRVNYRRPLGRITPKRSSARSARHIPGGLSANRNYPETGLWEASYERWEDL